MTAALQGTSVGNGHCVAYVRQVANLPHTSLWRRGERVRDASPPEGTPIATFGGEPPRYENRTDGASHAAILIAVRVDGVHVWDQWLGRTVQQRIIRFKGGAGKPADDGDAYFTIAVAASEVTA